MNRGFVEIDILAPIPRNLPVYIIRYKGAGDRSPPHVPYSVSSAGV